MKDSKTPQTQIALLYDGDCPICNRFTCELAPADHIKTINARNPSAQLEQSRRDNLNIDQGAIVYAEHRYYFGADAVHYIASQVQLKTVKGRLFGAVFRHKVLATLLYPLAKAARRISLTLLGRPLINSQARGPSSKTCAVFYNSACPICDAGIQQQKRRMKKCSVAWVDIHSHQDNVSQLNADIECVRQKLHVRDASGQIHIGLDAFICLWRDTPGEHWKATLFSAPLIHGVFTLIYNVFAWGLYQINRKRHRW